MRFEPRRTFASGRPVRMRRAPGDLPVELAFLERFGVARQALDHAVARARREGVDPGRALLAEGAVSEALYYRALALQLGVPFVDTWPRLAQPSGPHESLARGWVRLDGGCRWLLAPAVSDVRTLLRAQALRLTMPDIAIAAPTHFSALVCHRAQPEIARRASHALPELAPHLSAKSALTRAMLASICVCLLGLLAGLAWGWRLESDVLGLVFLAALVFRLVVIGEGLARDDKPAAEDIADSLLPTYSVLIPLRDEADMVGDLVAALAALEYPGGKREVLFLIEPDDPATRAALAAHRLPVGFRIVDLPPGLPHTKPRALNVGLLVARGDLVTVYDAEDRPEPDQLRRAAARFAAGPEELACLQARLSIANGSSGLLAGLFAIEYAALFDVFNLGLGRLRLPIALGGTSNHFRVAALRAVGGWDAWNVTEDADLGLRLARFGYAVDILDSTTWEDAPERLGIWFKQRRRWTKGWVQTLVVLLRDAGGVAGDLGPRRALAVALLLTNLVTGPLLTPFFLVLVLWHLAAFGLPTPRSTAVLLEATLAFSVIGNRRRRHALDRLARRGRPRSPGAGPGSRRSCRISWRSPPPPGAASTISSARRTIGTRHRTATRASHHQREASGRARDAGVEPAVAMFAERAALVEQDEAVPLRTLRLVDGQHVAEVERVGGAPARPAARPPRLA